ncbi:MAG: glycosyltransferase family 2 protein [Phascolarctobacterium sp.]
MFKISVLIPCYNEVENIEPLTQAIRNEFENTLPSYDFEIVYIDNYSIDGTRLLIEEECKKDKRVKAIFNSKNFGQFNSPYHGLCNTTGDCTILMCADFQDPVEMISKFVKEWERGYKVVIGIKNQSEENKLMYFFRSIYYKTIRKMSSVEQIEHFTGFGLYDKSFIQVLNELDDPTPFLRGIVAELGPKRKEILYTQAKRRAGKTHNNWYSLYDAAMLSFTSYTKVGLRIGTLIGFIFAIISMFIAIAYFIAKIIWWDRYPLGMIPITLGVFFFGSIQLFFLGFLGEYILSINTRVMKRPLVIEEKRINF